MSLLTYTLLCYGLYGTQLLAFTVNIYSLLLSPTAEAGACGIESTGRTPALGQRGLRPSVDSAYEEEDGEGDMPSLSVYALEQ